MIDITNLKTAQECFYDIPVQRVMLNNIESIALSK